MSFWKCLWILKCLFLSFYCGRIRFCFCYEMYLGVKFISEANTVTSSALSKLLLKIVTCHPLKCEIIDSDRKNAHVTSPATLRTTSTITLKDRLLDSAYHRQWQGTHHHTKIRLFVLTNISHSFYIELKSAFSQFSFIGSSLF